MGVNSWFVREMLPAWFVYAVANRAAADYSTSDQAVLDNGGEVPAMTMCDMLKWWCAKADK